MSDRAVQVLVTGRVQGVFFRASCADQARRHHVHGWVRNDPGGTVSAHFEGHPDDVEELVDWCHQGPPHADVAEVEVRDVAPEGHPDFSIR